MRLVNELSNNYVKNNSKEENIGVASQSNSATELFARVNCHLGRL